MVRSVEAAVIEEPGAEAFDVQEVQLEEPQQNEVRVDIEYAGACHTDWHAAEGALQEDYPVVGGHEGAGRVTAVGDGVTTVEEGDSVITLWVPSCGNCEMCTQGLQHLCVRGGESLYEGKLLDGTCRFQRDGEGLSQFLTLGTFAEEVVVPESEVVPVPGEFPKDAASIIGCGVATGYGSAVYRADIQPGDTVAIVGAGNVGLNAIQGAKKAGASRIIVSEPVDSKRETAREFGATHTIDPDSKEVNDALHEIDPAGADSLILAVGVATGEIVADCVPLLGPRGELILTAGGPSENIPISPHAFLSGERELKGCLYGGASPRQTVTEIMDMYQQGEYMIDELITDSYALNDINEAYDNLLNGQDIHSVIDV